MAITDPTFSFTTSYPHNTTNVISSGHLVFDPPAVLAGICEVCGTLGGTGVLCEWCREAILEMRRRMIGEWLQELE